MPTIDSPTTDDKKSKPEVKPEDNKQSKNEEASKSVPISPLPEPNEKKIIRMPNALPSRTGTRTLPVRASSLAQPKKSSVVAPSSVQVTISLPSPSTLPVISTSPVKNTLPAMSQPRLIKKISMFTKPMSSSHGKSHSSKTPRSDELQAEMETTTQKTETSTKTLKEVSEEVPKEVPKKKVPKKVPKKTPKKDHKKGNKKKDKKKVPKKTRRKGKSPKDSPKESPKESPLESPTGSPKESPTGSPKESPTASPTGSPIETSTPKSLKRKVTKKDIPKLPETSGSSRTFVLPQNRKVLPMKGTARRQQRSPGDDKKPEVAFCQQLHALLWKCFRVHVVQPWATAFELVGPVLVFLLITGNTISFENHIQKSNNLTVAEVNGNTEYHFKVPNEAMDWKDKYSLQFEVDDSKLHKWVKKLCYTPVNNLTRTLTESTKKKSVKNTIIGTINVFQDEKIHEVPTEDEAQCEATVRKSNHNYGIIYHRLGEIPEMYNQDDMKRFAGSVNFGYEIKLPVGTKDADVLKKHPKGNPVQKNKNALDRSTLQIQYQVNIGYLREVCSRIKFVGKDPCSRYIKPVRFYDMPVLKSVQSRGITIDDWDVLRWIQLIVSLFSKYTIASTAVLLANFLLSTFIVYRITEEKASRVRDLLRLIGMEDEIYWLSHFIDSFTIASIQCLIFSVGLWYMMRAINVGILFIVVLLGSIQTILFTLTLLAFYTSRDRSLRIHFVVWFGLKVIIYTWLQLDYETESDNCLNWYRQILALTPPGSLIFVFEQLGEFNKAKRSFNFEDLTILNGTFSAERTVSIMLLSILIYCFLIYYLDNVTPFQVSPKSPFFCLFSPFFSTPESYGQARDEPKDPKLFENIVREGVKEVYKLKNVTMKFPDARPSLSDVNLKIYPNEITVLLGPNGAGKSTLMNILTGMLAQTEGTVFMNGYDIQAFPVEARQSIAICAQENLFIPQLEVWEHLKLFAMLKGVEESKIEAQIQETLSQIKLSDKYNELAINLSGGLKRKLSLGMALIGDTRTLVLDEPTTGMDPNVKQSIWELLLRLKKSRNILLSTHSMPEADAIADRLIILNDGIITSDASPKYLKRSLGSGYKLRILKLANFNAMSFVSAIRKFVPNAKQVSDGEVESLYLLESSEKKKEQMPKMARLMQDLEKNKERLKIGSFSLQYSTLEDVFLMVSSRNDPEAEKKGLEDYLKTNEDGSEAQNLTKIDRCETGCNLYISQISALLEKRFRYTSRNLRNYFYSTLFMCLAVGLAIYEFRFGLHLIDDALKLSTKGIYGPETELFLYSSHSDFYAHKIGEAFTTIVERQEQARLYSINLEHSKDITKTIVANLTSVAINDNERYRRKFIYGIGVTEDEYIIWNNPYTQQARFLALGVLFDSILCAMLNVTGSEDCPRIDTLRTAVPLTVSDKDNLEMHTMLVWLSVSIILLPVALMGVVSIYIWFAVEENGSKVKLIQFLSRMSPMTYWVGNMIFDFLTFVVVLLLMVLIVGIFDRHHTMFRMESVLGSILLPVAFILAVLPFTYLVSLFFTDKAKVYNTMLNYYVANLVINLICSIVYVLWLFVQWDMEAYKVNYDRLVWVFRFSPMFSMIYGYQKIYLGNLLAGYCDLHENYIGEDKFHAECASRGSKNNSLPVICCPKTTGSQKTVTDFRPFELELGAAEEFAVLGASVVIYFVLLIWFETSRRSIFGFFHGERARSDQNSDKEDNDVRTERHRVENEVGTSDFQDALTVHHLSKSYGDYVAVEDLTFGVNNRECFGLLGVNGAGKTTAFSMLTGDQFPTSGDAYLAKGKYSLNDHTQEFQHSIGYCPQFDALPESLTGSETLTYYAKIRGIPEAKIAPDVKTVIKMVGLENYANVLSENYSSGNKRKLSLGVAIIGNPLILFLDEPTSGMDPGSRRKVWQSLAIVKHYFDCSIILTSHSMDECEALCSRIGIMVAGRFKCLGSSEHLRSIYGQGYRINITIKENSKNEEYLTKMQSKLIAALPSAVLLNSNQTSMSFHVTDKKEKWSNIFKTMIDLDAEFEFEDYTFSGTTLEQMFQMFARDARSKERTNTIEFTSNTRT